MKQGEENEAVKEKRIRVAKKMEEVGSITYAWGAFSFADSAASEAMSLVALAASFTVSVADSVADLPVSFTSSANCHVEEDPWGGCLTYLVA